MILKSEPKTIIKGINCGMKHINRKKQAVRVKLASFFIELTVRNLIAPLNFEGLPGHKFPIPLLFYVNIGIT